jgi:hypothetical protein
VCPFTDIQLLTEVDTKSPLHEAAVQAGILSPMSRLLRTSKNNTSRGCRATPASTSHSPAKSKVCVEPSETFESLTSGQGWSGSDSEEDDYFRVLQQRTQARRERNKAQSRRSSLYPAICVPAQLQSSSETQMYPPINRQVSLDSTDAASPLLLVPCDTPEINSSNKSRLSSVSTAASDPLPVTPEVYIAECADPAIPFVEYDPAQSAEYSWRKSLSPLDSSDLTDRHEMSQTYMCDGPEPILRVDGWGDAEVMLNNLEEHEWTTRPTAIAEESYFPAIPEEAMAMPADLFRALLAVQPLQGLDLLSASDASDDDDEEDDATTPLAPAGRATGAIGLGMIDLSFSGLDSGTAEGKTTRVGRKERREKRRSTRRKSSEAADTPTPTLEIDLDSEGDTPRAGNTGEKRAQLPTPPQWDEVMVGFDDL